MVVSTIIGLSLDEISVGFALRTFVGFKLLNISEGRTVSCEVGILLDEIDQVGTFVDEIFI